MKVYLEYELPQELPEYELAMNGARTKIALDEVWEKVFRPFYKYGYADEQLNELVKDEKVGQAIELLAKIYHEVLEENEVV